MILLWGLGLQCMTRAYFGQFGAPGKGRLKAFLADPPETSEPELTQRVQVSGFH